MNPITEFIESGILDIYVMGAASPEETREVEKMAAAHPEVQQEIERIRQALEQYALAHAVKPKSTVKTFLMASIDYIERLKQGELIESPPILTPQSKISDYEKWLSSEKALFPADEANSYAHIISSTPKTTTAIVWIREMAEEEQHHDEYERFLIVEGACHLTAGDKSYNLAAGDFFDVPLHTPHRVQVTSDVPCKAILQRLRVE